MKRKSVMALAVCVALAATGCASKPAETEKVTEAATTEAATTEAETEEATTEAATEEATTEEATTEEASEEETTEAATEEETTEAATEEETTEEATTEEATTEEATTEAATEEATTEEAATEEATTEAATEEATTEVATEEATTEEATTEEATTEEATTEAATEEATTEAASEEETTEAATEEETTEAATEEETTEAATEEATTEEATTEEATTEEATTEAVTEAVSEEATTEAASEEETTEAASEEETTEAATEEATTEAATEEETTEAATEEATTEAATEEETTEAASEEETTEAATEEATTEAATEEATTEVETETETETETEAQLVYPEFVALDYVELGDYKNIEVVVDPIVISDEQIAAQIADRTITTMTEGTVQDGDIVNIDYEGKLDGEAFAGGTAQGYDLEIGSYSFIDGFEEGLIGVNVGDTVDLNLTFPDNYHAEDLAGKETVFTVTVNSLQRVPELTDEVAQEKGYDSVDAFMDAVRAELEEAAKADQDAAVEYDAVMTLINDSKITSYPQETLDYMIATEKDYYTQVAAANGMELADMLSMYGMTEEQFMEQLQGLAEQVTTQSIVLQGVAEAEGMEISDEEYAEALADLASDKGAESGEALEEMFGKPFIINSLLQEKALAFIREHVVVKDTAEEESETDTEAASEEETTETATEEAESESETTAE